MNMARLPCVVAICVAVGLSTSCAPYDLNTDMKEGLTDFYKASVFVYGKEDEYGVRSRIEGGLKDLGFLPTSDRAKAQLTADYHYKGFYDVVHYTLLDFSLFISDAKSGKVFVSSRFRGETPLSAESIVKKVFRDIDDELGERVEWERTRR